MARSTFACGAPRKANAWSRSFQRSGPFIRPTHSFDVTTNYFLPGFWPHAALYLGDAEQLAALGLTEHTSVKPRWRRLLECDRAEPRRVFLEVRRELEEDRPEPRAQRRGDAEEVAELLAAVLEPLDVGDALRGLDHEGEALRHLRRPGVEQGAVRHPVEGVVDLDRGKPLGVEAQHVGVLEVLGVEAALPLLVAVAAGPHPQLHGKRALSGPRRRRPRSWP